MSPGEPVNGTVFLEKTAEELKNHDIKWPFWTKLVVVGVGFTGGLVFMYVQDRFYNPFFITRRSIFKYLTCIGGDNLIEILKIR